MKSAIVGIGQHFRGEDQIGLVILRKLKEDCKKLAVIRFERSLTLEEAKYLEMLTSNQLIETNGNLTVLMDCFSKFDSLIIIDAVISEQYPKGTLVWKSFAEIINQIDPEYSFTSSHLLSVKEAYLLSQNIEVLRSQVQFLGVVITSTQFSSENEFESFFTEIYDKIRNHLIS